MKAIQSFPSISAVWYYTAMSLVLVYCYQLMFKSRRVNKKLTSLLFYGALSVLLLLALLMSSVDIVSCSLWESSVEKELQLGE